jgi:hypothetical protein
LLDELTSAQLSEWEVYNRIDPIGEFRGDYRMAYLCSLIQNLVSKLYTKAGKSVKLTTPIDFMLDWSGDLKLQRSKKQSMEELKLNLLSFVITPISIKLKNRFRIKNE